MNRTSRPLRITLISIIGILGNYLIILIGFIGIISPSSYFAFLSPLSFPFNATNGLLVIFFLFFLTIGELPLHPLWNLIVITLGVFGALVYFGLLRKKYWAWVLALFLNGVSVASLIVFAFLISRVSTHALLLPLVMGLFPILALICLFTSGARTYFKEKAGRITTIELERDREV